MVLPIDRLSLPAAAHQAGRLPRYADVTVSEWLEELPAIEIAGAKGVGKTTVAKLWADRMIRLEAASLDSRGEAEALDLGMRFIDQADKAQIQQVVAIDEWQVAPRLWDFVRRHVDDKLPSQILLTGSATPPEGAHFHSGAGRIVTLHIRPFTLAEKPQTSPIIQLKEILSGDSDQYLGEKSEFTDAEYARSIVETGLPDIFDKTGVHQRVMLESYVQKITSNRDLAGIGVEGRYSSSNILSLFRAYAAATSTISSMAKIVKAVDGQGPSMSRPTVARYTELLTNLHLLDSVPTWMSSHNVLGTLAKSDKYQVFDPGLAAYVMQENSVEKLLQPQSNVRYGALFEALATLSVRGATSLVPGASVYHVRDAKGRHEIDLLVEMEDGRVLLIEIKAGSVFRREYVKGFEWFRSTFPSVEVIDQVILYSGEFIQRTSDGTLLLPLDLLW